MILKTPGITLYLFGSDEARYFFSVLTKRHPKYKIIKNKKYLVSLLKLPDNFGEYLSGRYYQNTRWAINKAIRSGYRVEKFDPNLFISDIFEINVSSETRQNRKMADSYTDINKVKDFCKDKKYFFGVFDKENKLKAYCYTPIIGDVFLINRILGHHDSLNDGVMFLLISEIIRDFSEKSKNSNGPSWSMYDSFFGNSDGIILFKKKLGYAPYNVNWKFRD